MKLPVFIISFQVGLFLLSLLGSYQIAILLVFAVIQLTFCFTTCPLGWGKYRLALAAVLVVVGMSQIPFALSLTLLWALSTNIYHYWQILRRPRSFWEL